MTMAWWPCAHVGVPQQEKLMENLLLTVHQYGGKHITYILSIMYNAKFWRAPIGRNRSRDAIVSLLSERLSVNSARLGNFRSKFSVVQ